MTARGVVVWVTGRPASGKSTLAREVARELRGAIVLDGDEVRGAIRPTPGYDESARDAFYETLARLAALLARQGHVVVVPATAPRRAQRERARALAPAFVEVYVDTPLEECARRDPKGLYARAAQDPSLTLPGVNAPFEPPDEADVVVRWGDDRLEAIVTRARELA